MTALLILVAIVQLSGINKNTQAEFLLKIDNRWGNSKNLKAREIIHDFFVQSEITHGRSNNSNIQLIIDDVKSDIMRLRVSELKDEQKKFLILLNFLEFLETVGYLCKLGYVNEKELNELCGYSLIFYFRIFQSYIVDKRNRYNKPNYYNYLVELIDKLEKNNSKK